MGRIRASSHGDSVKLPPPRFYFGTEPSVGVRFDSGASGDGSEAKRLAYRSRNDPVGSILIVIICQL